MMPQWDVLDSLADRARRYSTFDLRMKSEATDLVFDNDRVASVRATTPDGEIEIRADLTVGCDGRHSTLRLGQLVPIHARHVDVGDQYLYSRISPELIQGL
jgi:2-polyprenyl-6-methoxyphenol hydroxylase-like FAD-dependent oxidoreductase